MQIKARSRTVRFGDAALFAGLPHESRRNYWFVFYRADGDGLDYVVQGVHRRITPEQGRQKRGQAHDFFNGNMRTKRNTSSRDIRGTLRRHSAYISLEDDPDQIAGPRRTKPRPVPSTSTLPARRLGRSRQGARVLTCNTHHDGAALSSRTARQVADGRLRPTTATPSWRSSRPRRGMRS